MNHDAVSPTELAYTKFRQELMTPTSPQGTSAMSKINRDCLSRTALQAILDGLRGECLHDLLRRLRLHHHYLAEDLPLAGLRRGLRPGLEAAQARKGEDAGLLHLGRGDRCETVQHLRALRLLQLAGCRKLLSNGALPDGLLGRALHALHRCHGDSGGRCEG